MNRIALALALLLMMGCAGGARTLPLVSATGAIYPPAAREAGLEGYVVVRYDVDAEGRVINARVVDASPRDVFDEAALAAVSRWRFRAPAPEQAPIVGLRSRLTFELDSSERYQDY